MKTSHILLTALLALPISTGCEEKKKIAPAKPVEAPVAAQKEPAKVPAKVADPAPGDTAQAKGGTTEPAQGGGVWVKSAPYKVKFRVPEDWNVTIEEDGISATDSDETTTVVVVGSQSHSMIQAAIQDVQKKVKIEGVVVQDTKPTVLNGFSGHNVRGTAVLKKEDGIDQEIQFIAYNVRVDKATVVTMMIFSEAEMYEAKKETIEGLAKTLTKS